MSARHFSHYLNLTTGEISPAHRIGTTEDGLPLYQGVKGWEPVGAAYEEDADGNWIPLETLREARRERRAALRALWDEWCKEQH